MNKSVNQYGNTVYQLGKVKATLILFDDYQKAVAVLGINEAQDIQPDGHLGFVANVQNGNISEREIDANEQTIEKYLWEMRGAELALITMRAIIERDQSGYIRDLMENTSSEAYKIDRIISTQEDAKIIAELEAWKEKWIA